MKLKYNVIIFLKGSSYKTLLHNIKCGPCYDLQTLPETFYDVVNISGNKTILCSCAVYLRHDGVIIFAAALATSICNANEACKVTKKAILPYVY
jgi:hypothetical protein